MNNTISKSATVRASSRGRGMAPDITPAQLVLSRESIERQFSEIDKTAKTDAEAVEQRRAAIDFMLERANDGTGWAKFYAAIEFIRDNAWYWQDKGFATFDDFWKDKGAPGFTTFADMENMHHFAKVACPELFGVDISRARELYSQVDRLAKIAPMKNRGQGNKLGNNNAVKAKSAVTFGSRDAAMDRIAAASTFNPNTPGSNSIERRMARIKRDHPDVAAKILAGHYIKHHSSGTFSVDMNAAELDAYGETRTTQSKADKKHRAASPVNVAKLIRKALKQYTPKEIIDAINQAGIVGFKVREVGDEG